ncbi:aminopeptidase N [Pelistega europaea]|uniref:Aminopeptidase N n=1 Tax=Pelistega europaea TaxID=106147 RepID=A0A7Y4LA24_9BURK|nr:aminopeptidase N [Pelistega europaea]NOL49745.1 aminopeptidase N [Pelistega europaea]
MSTTIYRKDYQPYPYHIEKVSLHFSLDVTRTVVTNTMTVTRKADMPRSALILNGEDIQLESVSIDGQTTTDYTLQGEQLILHPTQDHFELTVTSTCNPSANSTLMGLYVSGNSFFTQCEAEGFRRITFYPDRPDVMSEFFVTLEADKAKYPYLLSNGNLIHTQDLDNGRHQCQWHDPFLKPCYLFALVAGDFDIREKTSKTRSGRDVLLQVYSDKGNGDQTLWALDSLERAMFWDEQRFNLELDLDRFMVVAVRDFNMGAMENKGLNIFNAAYVLADPETATDANFEGIESVIGHEYFHNWTGNRVTCRDWFQLSLKEGLTVFRDQEFSADMMARNLPPQAALSARTVKRIDDVTRLRTAQFPEDAGPMAHPIRPDSYQEIGNFYTATVYEKGAEVIRMQHTLLGEQGFQAGMQEYFHRHDGQAVTCDDFVNAMESVYCRQHPGKDLSVFRHWYSQAGTPTVQVQMDYDETKQACTITLTQSCPKVGVEKLRQDFDKKPYHIPFHIGMLTHTGLPIPLKVEHLDNARTTENHGVLLELQTQTQSWTFTHIPERPVLSLLRDFSAPVYVSYPYPAEELAVLCAHDVNPFARWEAAQELASREILRITQQIIKQQGNISSITVDTALLKVWLHNLTDMQLDAGYRSWLLALPTEKVLLERLSPMQPQALYLARRIVKESIASTHRDLWMQTYRTQHTTGEYRPDPISVGQRSLKNLALNYLLSIQDNEAISLAKMQYDSAANMTDRLGALSALMHYNATSEAIYGNTTVKAMVAQLNQDFYQHFENNPLVVDKWFALQATSAPNVAHIRELMQHPAFVLRNPNRARALLFQFCMNNTRAFHDEDGSAYAFWAEQVIALDALNPEVAARFSRVMDSWQRYAEPFKTLMQKALQKVAEHQGLSKNTTEIVSKALSI